MDSTLATRFRRFQRKNTTGVFFETDSAFADLGSGLKFAKTDGLALKYRSAVSTRFWLLGWSDKSCGTSPSSAFSKS